MIGLAARLFGITTIYQKSIVMQKHVHPTIDVTASQSKHSFTPPFDVASVVQSLFKKDCDLPRRSAEQPKAMTSVIYQKT